MVVTTEPKENQEMPKKNYDYSRRSMVDLPHVLNRI